MADSLRICLNMDVSSILTSFRHAFRILVGSHRQSQWLKVPNLLKTRKRHILRIKYNHFYYNIIVRKYASKMCILMTMKEMNYIVHNIAIPYVKRLKIVGCPIHTANEEAGFFFFCSTNLKRRMINLGLEIGGRRTTEGRWMQIQWSIFIDYKKRKFLQLEKISSSQIILCSMPKKHARCLLERPVTRPDWENLTCHQTHEEAVLDAAGALSFVKSCMCREILVLHSSS